MSNGDQKQWSARAEVLWSLQKDGGQLSFILTKLESGGFELKLIRSDVKSRSVQLFRLREEAMAEAERELLRHVAGGWAIDTDRR